MVLVSNHLHLILFYLSHIMELGILLIYYTHLTFGININIYPSIALDTDQ